MPIVYGNGEPGCKTEQEINQKFRNNWDPTSYWQCGGQNEPAQVKHCKGDQLYSDVHKKCVPYTDWHWSEPVEPPSKPNEVEKK